MSAGTPERGHVDAPRQEETRPRGESRAAASQKHKASLHPQPCHGHNFPEWKKVSEHVRETPVGAAGGEGACPGCLETEWALPRAPAAMSPLSQRPAPRENPETPARARVGRGCGQSVGRGAVDGDGAGLSAGWAKHREAPFRNLLRAERSLGVSTAPEGRLE